MWLTKLLRTFPIVAQTPVANHAPYELHHHGTNWELVIITAGTGRHLLGPEAFAIGAGDVFVVQAGMQHGYSDCEGLGVVNILFDPRRLQLPENQLLQAPGYAALFHLEPKLRARHQFQSRLRVERDTLTQILESFHRMRTEIESQKPGYQAAATAHFCHIIVELARHYGDMTAPMPQALVRLSGVAKWLERNFDKEVTVDGLADIAHMSRTTFLRTFRSCFGVSPMSYVTRLRLEKAAHLLRDSEARVKEVAPLVGIEDSNYFARLFRRHMGVDPKGYRLQHRQSLNR